MTVDDTPRATRPRTPQRVRLERRRLVIALATGAVAAMFLAATSAVSGSSGHDHHLAGGSDSGPLSTFALPMVRTAAELAAVVTVGLLLMASFLAPPADPDALSRIGGRAQRLARRTAAAWAATAALMVPLTVAEVVGQPLSAVLTDVHLLGAATRIPSATAWGMTAGFAVAVAALVDSPRYWRRTVATFLIALLGLVPVAATGHAAGDASHATAIDTMLLHVLAAALWLGGLVAVLIAAHDREADAELAAIVTRFSRLALVCWAVMAITGLLNALVRVAPSDLFGSSYGSLVVAKAAALALLGGFGHLQRRRAVPALQRGRSRALLTIGAAETTILLATVGLAVALGRTAPPPTAATPYSPMLESIGYELTEPPSITVLLGAWRLDALSIALTLGLVVIYLVAVHRLSRRGAGWPARRTALWLSGCALLLIATDSGISRYVPATFSVLVLEEMLLLVVVPILLTAGAPLTLALSSTSDATGAPSPLLAAMLSAPPLRRLTHPAVSAVLFVGAGALLLLTDVFVIGTAAHLGHHALDGLVLAVGLLFVGSLSRRTGSSPRVAPRARTAVLLTALGVQAAAGAALGLSTAVRGEVYYESLGLPWALDLLSDQRWAAAVWISGQGVAVITLVVRWWRQRPAAEPPSTGDAMSRTTGDIDATVSRTS